MRVLAIIFSVLLSFGLNAQCDISAQDILKLMNCDSIAAHCPNLGGGNSNIELERCTGTFENCNGQSGNRFVIPETSANTGWLYLGGDTNWQRVGNTIITSPDCVVDLSLVVDLGVRYWFNVGVRVYSYYDVRLLINGVAVQTNVGKSYEYIPRNDLRDPDIDDIATVVFHRDNVPAGSTVEVQMRMRYNINDFQGNDRARLIWGGLRSEIVKSSQTDSEITDVTILKEKYWIQDAEYGYSYGLGDAPDGAKSVGSKKAQDNQIKVAQRNLDKELEVLVPEKEN